MVIEALRQAFDDFVQPLELRQQMEAPQAVADEYKALYLSEQQCRSPGPGLPDAGAGSDVARATDAPSRSSAPVFSD